MARAGIPSVAGAQKLDFTSSSCRKVHPPKHQVMLTDVAWRRNVGRMSAQPIHSPKVMSVPAATPAAIRAVLVNAAEPGLLERFNSALDRAVAEAKESDSLAPLNEMLKRWRLEAAVWCDPVKHRAFLAKWDDYARNGVPDSERADPNEVLAILEAKGASKVQLDKLRSVMVFR